MGTVQSFPFALSGEIFFFPHDTAVAICFFFSLKTIIMYQCAPLLLFAISPYQHPCISVTGTIKGEETRSRYVSVCVCVVCMSAHCKDENFAVGLLHG